MDHLRRYAGGEGSGYVSSQLLREEYRAVLAAGTPEAHVHKREATFKEIFDSRVDETEGVLPKRRDLRGGLEVRAHVSVESGLALESLLPSWIGKRAAVEDESATMTLPLKREQVWGEGSFEREAGNLDGQI